MSLSMVILAAGAGSRYGGPKQLEPVGPSGETLLEYSTYDALRAGFGQIVLVVQPEHESEFRRRFAGKMADHVEVSYAHQSLTSLPGGVRPPAERRKPWGTGQAVLAASGHVDGGIAVVNADDWYGRDSYGVLADFLREHDRGPVGSALVGFPVAQTLTEAGPVSRAWCEVDAAGRLRSIVELSAVWEENGRILYEDARGATATLQGNELVSMNMWGLAPGLLAELESRFAEFLCGSGRTPDKEFLLPEFIQSVVQDGTLEIRVIEGSGEWCGITYPADRQHVAGVLSGLINKGIYPKELWK